MAKTGPIRVNPKREKETPHKESRTVSFEEVVEIHRFPLLTPFGMTTLRKWPKRGNWSISCGKLSLTGVDGNIAEILTAFVEFLHKEVGTAKQEVINEFPQSAPTH